MSCSRYRNVLFGFVFTVSAITTCSGSPSNSILLRLVPSGAQIVAGFEHRHDRIKRDYLVLVTINNRVDLNDWQSIAAVDDQRTFDEVIEVAYSPMGNKLTEHLLLVAGQFDRKKIFHSVGRNGARTIEYRGETVMLMQPFSREKDVMPDARWLIILENRIVLFGTPMMVQKAFSRHQSHAEIDMPLRERLTHLPHDVTSWSVLTPLHKPQSKNVWERFFDEANVFVLGLHYGSRVRVHVWLHFSVDHGKGFLEQKVTAFSKVFGSEELHRLRGDQQKSVEISPDHMQASLKMSRRQFVAWGKRAGYFDAMSWND